ncbi:uncharacterized protein [Lepeophtheirus salmonis]|nr:uncharacterized protein LOC121130117 isoform X1 [Lepeophtheirus salmonis]
MNVTSSELLGVLPMAIKNPRLFSLPTEEFRSYFQGFNRNSSLRNILRYSVLSDNTSLFRAIIRAFPDVNCKITMDGYSNLSHHAAYHGNLEMLKYLIRIGAAINKNGTVNNSVNGTASEIALEMNHLECYSVLQMESAKYDEYTASLFNDINNDMGETHKMNLRLNAPISESLTEDHKLLDDAVQLLDKLKLKLLQLCKTENLRMEDFPRLKLTIQSYKTFANIIAFGKQNKYRCIAQLKMIGNGIQEMFESDEDFF